MKAPLRFSQQLPLAAMAGLALLAALAPAYAQPRAGAAQTAEPVEIARHIAIMDGETGILLRCDECEVPMPPASMSKLMTVLAIADRLKDGRLTLDTMFPVSERAWRNGAMSDGSHMFLELGSQVSVRDLLNGVIIVSANDACIVLAEGVAGSEEAFVAELNQRAQDLGLRSARFRNTTGLPDPEHVISAADLARLARHLMVNYPDLYRIYSQPEFTYNNRTQQNRNPLLGAFEGADGVKTGHTNASGYGLVGSASLNGERRIIVFNGAPTMAARRSEAVRLMRAAFHDYGVTRLYDAGAEVGQAEIWLGGRKTVGLATQAPVVIAGPRSALAALQTRVIYQGPLRAPVAQGAPIARLVVEAPGMARQEFPLAASRRVGRANPFARAWTGLMLTLGAGT